MTFHDLLMTFRRLSTDLPRTCHEPATDLPPTFPGPGVCQHDGAVALASSDGAVTLLATERLGHPDAVISRFALPTEDGALLAMGSLGRPGGGAASASDPLLLYTTEAGEAVAVDPRSGTAAWRLRCERPLGLMQAFASDAACHWLLLGSSTGHCVLWDLRYSLRLHAWQSPTASRIHTLLPVRTPNSARPTVLAGLDDNVVVGYELGDAAPRCILLLQPVDAADHVALAYAAPSLPPLTLAHPPPLMMAPPPASVAAAAATAAAAGGSSPLRPSAPPTASASHGGSAAGSHSVRALAAPLDGSCVLTASSDTRLRCWQLQGDAGASFTVGGLPADAQPTRFENARGLTNAAGCRVLREMRAETGATGGPTAAAEAAGAASATAAQRAATVGAEDVGCTAAVTSVVYCPSPSRAPQPQQPGLLLAGSLDGIVRVWR